MAQYVLAKSSVQSGNAAARRFVRSATIVAVATLAIIGFVNGQSATATNEQSKAEFTYVTVLAGQSLWQIAADVAPTEDPRDFIADVVSLNALTSADVVPGQRIALPN
jgi:hypothetical protein